MRPVWSREAKGVGCTFIPNTMTIPENRRTGSLVVLSTTKSESRNASAFSSTARRSRAESPADSPPVCSSSAQPSASVANNTTDTKAIRGEIKPATRPVRTLLEIRSPIPLIV